MEIGRKHFNEAETLPDVKEVREILGKMEGAFKSLRDEQDKIGKKLNEMVEVDSTTIEKIEKIVEDLGKKEDELAAVVAKLDKPEEDDEDEDENKKKKKNARSEKYYNGVNALVRETLQGKMIGEYSENVMSVFSGTSGGYLTSPVMSPRIIEKIFEISNIRELITVETTADEKIQHLVMKNDIEVRSTTERGERTAQDLDPYGMREITLAEKYARIPITHQLLKWGGEKVESHVVSWIAKSRAKYEGNKFFNGTGLGEPEGILVNSAVQTAAVASGVSQNFDADSLKTLVTAPAIDFWNNARLVFNQDTMRRIWMLASGIGEGLWVPGIAGGRPNTILGYPYVVVRPNDMPNVGANAFPIAFGDFKEAYAMYESEGLRPEAVRDTQTMRYGQIEIWAYWYIGGAVVNAEPIRLLKCGA